MNPRTYQAQSMADALAEVKRDLGRDAVILHTRSFRKGGLLGIGGRHWWEITAAPNNMQVPRRVPRGSYVLPRAGRGQECTIAQDRHGRRIDRDGLRAGGRQTSEPRPEGNGGSRQDVEQRKQAAQTRRSECGRRRRPGRELAPQVSHCDPRNINNVQPPIEGQIGDIRRMVEALLSMKGGEHNDGLTDELRAIQQHLRRQEVDEEITQALIGDLRMSLDGHERCDVQILRARLADMIERRIPAARGAGRLAASYLACRPHGRGQDDDDRQAGREFQAPGRQEGRAWSPSTLTASRPSISSALTPRSSRCRCKVVLTAAELHQAVDSLRDMDVVLMDTAGRSQNDRRG